MRKKVLFGIITSVIFFIISFLGYKTVKFEQIKKRSYSNIQKLPPLNFKFKNFDSQNIAGKSVIVNYFSPACEHCQYMISKILENKTEFAHTYIFMITPAKESDIEKFSEKYKLGETGFINIGIDTSFSFFKTFGSSLIPSFFIYNAKHELDTVFKGETKIENIISRIK